jgi:membrane-associated phospholipid phosphatase
VNEADRAVFHWINGWPDGLTPLMRFLSEATDVWPGRVLLLAVLIALLWSPATRFGGVVAALCWPLANLLTDVWKFAWPVPRPPGLIDGVIERVGITDSMGTASAHSANMAFVAAALWLTCGPKWGVPWALVAFGVGLSRVYLGAHFPMQVLLGWATGVFAAWVLLRTIEAGRRLFRKPATAT